MSNSTPSVVFDPSKKRDKSWSEAMKNNSHSMYSRAYHKAGKRLTAHTRAYITGHNLSATGELYRSVGYSTIDGVFSEADKEEDMLPAVLDEAKFIFGVGAPHAQYVLDGTGPYVIPPPLEAIIEWARTKGLSERVARAVAQTIFEHGTQPKHFMPSDSEIERTVMEAMDAEFGLYLDELPDITIKVHI